MVNYFILSQLLHFPNTTFIQGFYAISTLKKKGGEVKMADNNQDENIRNQDDTSGQTGQKGGQATNDQDAPTQGLEDEEDMGSYVE